MTYLWRRSVLGSIIAGLVVVATGCATGPGTSPATPVAATPSLVETKREVTAYVDSGRYDAEIASVVEQARAFLPDQVEPLGAATRDGRRDGRHFRLSR